MKPPYLSKRGRVYQFSRRIPDDVQPVIGEKLWRWTLGTDSRTEAEKACRRDTVATDEIIDAVRAGTYRRFSDGDLDVIAFHWSRSFQEVNRSLMPRDMFPDVFDEEPRIGDEAPNSILRSRSDVASSLETWLKTPGIEKGLKDNLDKENDPTYKLAFTPNDFEALIDTCIDAYLVANPEISASWKDALADVGYDMMDKHPDHVEVVQRGKRVPERRKLSSMFEKYADGMEIGESARSDFGLGVRRFIQLHGDLDVAEINRRHIEDFRDILRQMPSRPPNNVRKLAMTEQVAWAEGLDIKRIGQAAINKNITGVRVTLQYAFDETSEIENRDWRNPCDGFTKKPKKTETPIRGFTDDELAKVFSGEIHKTKAPEDFWIPVVLFFTGARLDEISQLNVSDVVMEPVPHLVYQNLYDENPAIAKKVKSISSNRTIPIHRTLIEIGFLKYVDAIRRTGAVHVFPDLPHQQGGKRGNKVSRAFIRNFRKHGERQEGSTLNTKQLVTHSLRHSFRRAGFRGSTDQEFVQVVMGHYVGGVSFEVYGNDIYRMPDVLAERVMDVIQLPHVDLDYLKSEADRYLEMMPVLPQRR